MNAWVLSTQRPGTMPAPPILMLGIFVRHQLGALLYIYIKYMHYILNRIGVE